MSENGVIQFDPAELEEAQREWKEKNPNPGELPIPTGEKTVPGIPQYIEKKVPKKWDKMGSMAGTIGEGGEPNSEAATEVVRVINPAWKQQQDEIRIQQKIDEGIARAVGGVALAQAQPVVAETPAPHFSGQPAHPELGMVDVAEIQEALKGQYNVTGFAANGPVLQLQITRV